jgi:hypothetical protein
MNSDERRARERYKTLASRQQVLTGFKVGGFLLPDMVDLTTDIHLARHSSL